MASKTDKQLTAERLIGLLLEEPKILQKILLSLKQQARNYTEFYTSPEDKRIYFGKYAWSGFGGFWNRLIKCCDHISYDEFYIRVWDALLEMTTNPIAHKAIMEGLSKEVLLQGIHAGDEKILQRFFDVCRHITDDGFWRDKGLDNNSAVNHHTKVYNDPETVEVEVKPQNIRPTHTLRVVDCVGDVFEVLTGRWIGGRG
jgi:hypothetical protein